MLRQDLIVHSTLTQGQTGSRRGGAPLLATRPSVGIAPLTVPAARDVLLVWFRASEVGALIEAVWKCGARPLVFAGSVRDAVRWTQLEVEGGNRLPRDFDVGILGMSRRSFDNLLGDLGAVRNRYGGYRVLERGHPAIDVWRLEETWGLRITNSSASLINVLRSFVLDVNAIAFDPHTELFYDWGSIRAITARSLGIAREPILHSHSTFAAKALLSSMRWSASLTPELARFVRRYLDINALAYEAKKAFGQRVILNFPQEIYNAVRGNRPYSQGRRLSYTPRAFLGLFESSHDTPGYSIVETVEASGTDTAASSGSDYTRRCEVGVHIVASSW